MSKNLKFGDILFRYTGIQSDADNRFGYYHGLVGYGVSTSYCNRKPGDRVLIVSDNVLSIMELDRGHESPSDIKWPSGSYENAWHAQSIKSLFDERAKSLKEWRPPSEIQMILYEIFDGDLEISCFVASGEF